MRESDHGLHTTEFERNLMFFMGLGILVAVPAFKTVTHLPPFMGILFGWASCGWLAIWCIDTRKTTPSST